MAKRRHQSPVSLVRTGYQPEAAAPALPEGKSADAIKVEPWGPNNLQPQDILKVLYDSGTATNCAERLSQFINGRGFANEATAKLMANPEQTFNDLLAEASEYAAVGLGVAYIVRYNFGGTISETYVAAVDCMRREKEGGAGRYVINNKLALGKMPMGDNEVYLPYRATASQEEIQAEVWAAFNSPGGYWGHISFPFHKKIGRNVYPIPSWWSGKEAIEADAELPKYELKQFRNGFFPDAIITVVGKKYDDQPDDDWEPEADQDERDRPMVASADRAAIIATLEGLKGTSPKAGIMLNTVETENEKPQIDIIDKGPNSKGLTDATGRVEGRVYRLMQVPPVLCGVAEPGMLGSNQQIVNNIALFGLTVNKRRAQCTDPLAKFFPGLDLSVLPLNPVKYIDPTVAAKMTDDEIRAIEDLKPLEKPQDTEAEKTLKALNGLSPLVANKVLESMTEDEIRGLVALGPKTTAQPAPTPTPTPKP